MESIAEFIASLPAGGGLETFGRGSKWGKATKVAVGAVFAILTITTAIVIITANTQGVSFGRAQGYCEQYGMKVETGKMAQPDGDYLVCRGDGGTNIEFTVYTKPMIDTRDYERYYRSVRDEWTILEDNEGCKKIYYSGEDGVNYRIIENNYYIDLKADDNETAKNALIELGYPDRNWPN